MECQVVAIKGRMMMSPIKEQIVAENQTFGWTDEQTLADFANEHSEYYCLMSEKSLIGYVGLHHILDEATINMIYIQPKYRQKGLATSLLNYVLEQLAYRAIRHLFLEVRESNHSAIKLYRRAGFERLISRQNYYQNPTENAIIMQKKIEEGEIK